FVAGVTLVRSGQTEIDLRMAPGERVTVAGQVLTFEGVTAEPGPNYQAQRGSITVAREGSPGLRLHPEKRRYSASPAMPMTEAAISSSWRGDLYVALGDEAGPGAWTLRIHHKPYVTWIWGGCAFMALGGLLAAADRRWRGGEFPHPGQQG
ncbi:MAG: cytochrome c-type biogenesis CcmF C-terminal domain-containing protein, partial [Aquabacterium sp.]|nr:cytochrome c-type biogenesis CcmF C-terminal domain-containing protein [Aquabacterium sp.]